MYKMIVVDDEYMLRKGLNKFFSSNPLGFVVVDTFKSGEDAIKYLRKYKVDFVLTDIRMNGMSGIDLAHKIKSENIESVVSILSGYSDFEYARSAIQSSVFEYLLKPINFEELTQLAQKVKKHLDDKSKDHERYMNISLGKFLEFIVSGSLTHAGSWKNQFEEFGLEKYIIGLECCEITLTGNVTIASDAINVILGNSVSHNAFNIHDIRSKADEIRIIFVENPSVANCESFRAEVEKTFRILKKEVFNTFGKTVTISSVNYYKSISDFAESQTFDFIRKRVLKLVTLISSAINEENEERIKEYAITLFFELEHFNSTEKISTAREIHAELCGAEDNTLISLENIINDGITIDDIVNYLISIMRRKRVENKHAYFVVEKVKTLIAANVGANVSLTYISDSVHLNPKYLSKVFKQYCGESFTEYVINVRMQKARYLIENTSMKLKDIGSLVGYENQKYFIKVFKNHFSTTPSDFRRGVPK